MLDPDRDGPGLFCRLAPADWESIDDAILVDESPKVNVGPKYQCRIPPLVAGASKAEMELSEMEPPEQLLWDPSTCADRYTDQEGRIFL